MALITPGIPHARIAAKRLMSMRTRPKEACRRFAGKENSTCNNIEGSGNVDEAEFCVDL